MSSKGWLSTEETKLELVEYKESFATLAQYIKRKNPKGIPRITRSPTEDENQANVEAYCSNSADGSTVTRETAEAIFEGGHPQLPTDALRNDAHDLRNAIAVTLNPRLRNLNPAEMGEWLDLLCERHRRLLSHRPRSQPGIWKTVPNGTELHTYVQPTNVGPLLRYGHRRAQELASGIGRATFEHYVIVAVHPFLDGNGRTSRSVANAELSQAKQERCTFTFLFRNDLIAAMEQMHHNRKPDAVLDVWQECQLWTSRQSWVNRDAVFDRLEREGHIKPAVD